MKEEYEKIAHFYNLKEDKFEEVKKARSELGYEETDILRTDVIIARLNANTYESIVMKYRILSFPALLYFPQGETERPAYYDM